MDTVFLDIGCGDGSRAESWIDQDRTAHVFCFDPRPECYQSVTARSARIATQRKQIQRMHAFQVAITDSAISTNGANNKADFHVLNDASSCSLLPLQLDNIRRWKYPAGRHYFEETNVVEVSCMRIEKFLADRRINQVLFARVEVQGSALDVLKSFGKRITTVMEFAIKVHTTDFAIYTGQTTREELLQFMSANGFAVFGKMPWSKGQEEIIWFVNKKAANNPRLTHFDLL